MGAPGSCCQRGHHQQASAAALRLPQVLIWGVLLWSSFTLLTPAAAASGSLHLLLLARATMGWAHRGGPRSAARRPPHPHFLPPPPSTHSPLLFGVDPPPATHLPGPVTEPGATATLSPLRLLLLQAGRGHLLPNCAVPHQGLGASGQEVGGAAPVLQIRARPHICCRLLLSLPLAPHSVGAAGRTPALHLSGAPGGTLQREPFQLHSMRGSSRDAQLRGGGSLTPLPSTPHLTPPPYPHLWLPSQTARRRAHALQGLIDSPYPASAADPGRWA
jgi:hypothetical protein